MKRIWWALLLALWPLAVVHAAPASPAAGNEAVEHRRQATREVLGDARYLFCHRPDYILFPDEKEWCPQVGPTNAVCPDLPAACAAKRTRSGCARSEPAENAAPSTLLSQLWHTLFWVLIFAAVAGLVWLIAKHAIPGSQSEPEADHHDDARPDPEHAASLVAKQIETDVQRLLARARHAAETGDYGEAIRHAHAALVRRLEGDGLIRVHASRTNGDFLADLAGQPDLRAEVREVMRAVEGVEFGNEPPSRPAFDNVFARVQDLTSRTLVKGLLLVLMAGLIFSCDVLHRGDDDDSPSGLHAVVELLNRGGAHAKLRVQSLTKEPEETSTLVLLPGSPVLSSETQTVLLERAAENGTLILTGNRPDQQCLRRAMGVEVKDSTVSGPLRVGAAFRAQLGDLQVVLPGRAALELLDLGASKAQSNESAECPGVPRARAVLKQRSVLLDRAGTPYAVVADFQDDEEDEGGRIILFADAQLFSNIALAAEDNGPFLTGLLSDPEVEFATELTGATADSPMASIRHGGMAPFLLQLGAVTLLFLFCQGVRFGTPRDPEQRRRRAFADHVRALGAVYAKAQAARHALASYSAYAFDRLRERLQLRGRRGFHLMAEALAARTNRPLGEVARVLAETYELRASDGDDRSPAAIAQDLQLMKELEALMRAQRRRGP